MERKTEEFLKQYRFALIGFSRSGRKFGNYIYRRLSAKGLHVDPINPTGETVDGITTYKNLGELPVKPQAAVIAVKASSVRQAIQEAIDAGIKRVWIIGSAFTGEVEQLCRDNGVEIIHNRCILMYFGGFPHNLHYLIHRLTKRTSRVLPSCSLYDTLGEWLEFHSDFDGSEQRFWLGLPEKFHSEKPHMMALYFHQQGSDWSGVLTSGMYDHCRRNSIIAASTDYRGPTSHLDAAGLGDIAQVLRLLKGKYNISKWFACGVSMGAISAIQLSYLLPEEIRPAGVLAVLPAFSIIDFYNSLGEETRKAIRESYAGSPDQKPDEYDRRSPHANISRINSAVPFAVFAATRDKIAPIERHSRLLVEALKANGNTVHYREIEAEHDPELFSDCYKEGLDFLIKSTELCMK